MTKKDLEYTINWVDQVAAGFEETDSNFERSSTVGKCYQTVSHITEKLWKEESNNAANLTGVLY